MADDHSSQSRLTELEVKIAFMDDLLDGLNRIVFRQQEQIGALQRQIMELRGQLQASLPAEPHNPAEEIPPHY